MKKFLFVAVAIVLLSGCSKISPVQNYRFADDKNLHSVQVYFDWWATRYDLIIDDAVVIKDITENKSGTWNSKKISVESFYSGGLFGTNSFLIYADNEKIARVDM